MFREIKWINEFDEKFHELNEFTHNKLEPNIESIPQEDNSELTNLTD